MLIFFDAVTNECVSGNTLQYESGRRQWPQTPGQLAAAFAAAVAAAQRGRIGAVANDVVSLEIINDGEANAFHSAVRQVPVYNGALITGWTSRPEKAEERVTRLTTRATEHALSLGCAVKNPLTKQPVSSETQAVQRRSDAFAVEQYCTVALAASTTPQATKDAIVALFAERDRLMRAFLLVKAHIDDGTITTEVQVLEPARW